MKYLDKTNQRPKRFTPGSPEERAYLNLVENLITAPTCERMQKRIDVFTKMFEDICEKRKTAPKSDDSQHISRYFKEALPENVSLISASSRKATPTAIDDLRVSAIVRAFGDGEN